MTRILFRVALICVWVALFFYERKKAKKKRAAEAQAELEQKFTPPPDSAEALAAEAQQAMEALPKGTPEERQAFERNTFALYLATGAVMSLRERLDEFTEVKLFVLPDRLAWRTLSKSWQTSYDRYEDFHANYVELGRTVPELGADAPFSALNSLAELSALTELVVRELHKEPRLQELTPAADGCSYQAMVSAGDGQEVPTDPKARLEWQMKQLLKEKA